MPGDATICLCAALIASEALRKALVAVGYDCAISIKLASATRNACMSLFSLASAEPPGFCDPASPPSGEPPLPGIRPDMESSPWGDGAFIPASMEGEADAGELTSGTR